MRRGRGRAWEREGEGGNEKGEEGRERGRVPDEGGERGDEVAGEGRSDSMRDEGDGRGGN